MFEQVRPTGHDGQVGMWMPARPAALVLWRTCSICGSVHPDDLIAMLEHGATLKGEDWQHGWPHRFTVEGIYNPRGGPKTLRAHWYNAHLMDAGYTPEEQAQLIGALFWATDILFEVAPSHKSVTFHAPYYNYQRVRISSDEQRQQQRPRHASPPA